MSQGGLEIFDEPPRRLSPWLLWPLRVLAVLGVLAFWFAMAIDGPDVDATEVEESASIPQCDGFTELKACLEAVEKERRAQAPEQH